MHLDAMCAKYVVYHLFFVMKKASFFDDSKFYLINFEKKIYNAQVYISGEISWYLYQMVTQMTLGTCGGKFVSPS